MSNNNSFMGYTRSDLTNFLIAMILSFVAIPLVVQTDYWYSSILIPWLCLALAAIGQQIVMGYAGQLALGCLLYTSPSPRDRTRSRMPSSA